MIGRTPSSARVLVVWLLVGATVGVDVPLRAASAHRGDSTSQSMTPTNTTATDADASTVVPLFDGGALDHWESSKARKRATVVGDVLSLAGKSDRLATKESFDDFELTFEARQVDASSRGRVLVRMLPRPPVLPSSLPC